MKEELRNPDGTFKKKILGYRKKTCTGCGQHLFLGHFYKYGKSKNYPDGYDCQCKECRRRQKKEEYARKHKVPDGIRVNHQGKVVQKNGSSVRLYWHEQKVRDFKRLFPFNTNEDVAVDMECSVRTVTRRARELGLKKDPRWLESVWNKNRKMAHTVNKICGFKNDMTNFIEGGRLHRFQSDNHPSRSLTPEERSERSKKAWATRRLRQSTNQPRQCLHNDN